MKNLKKIVVGAGCGLALLVGGLHTQSDGYKQKCLRNFYSMTPDYVLDEICDNDGKYTFLIMTNRDCFYSNLSEEHNFALQEKLKDSKVIDVLIWKTDLEPEKANTLKRKLGMKYASPACVAISPKGKAIFTDTGYVFNPRDSTRTHLRYMEENLMLNIPSLEKEGKIKK